MFLNLNDILYCINFLFWLLEINVNNYNILRSVNYLSRNAEGDKGNSCKNLLLSSQVYSGPFC